MDYNDEQHNPLVQYSCDGAFTHTLLLSFIDLSGKMAVEVLPYLRRWCFYLNYWGLSSFQEMSFTCNVGPTTDKRNRKGPVWWRLGSSRRSWWSDPQLWKLHFVKQNGGGDTLLCWSRLWWEMVGEAPQPACWGLPWWTKWSHPYAFQLGTGYLSTKQQFSPFLESFLDWGDLEGCEVARKVVFIYWTSAQVSAWTQLKTYSSIWMSVRALNTRTAEAGDQG